MKDLVSLEVIDDKKVRWVHNDSEAEISFSRNIFQAVYLERFHQFLIIADYREVGKNNLFIYDADGEIIARPEMPDLNTTVDGVYAIWYVAGKTEQTIVLLTPDQANYETKCNFSLLDYSFSDFSLTK